MRGQCATSHIKFRCSILLVSVRCLFVSDRCSASLILIKLNPLITGGKVEIFNRDFLGGGWYCSLPESSKTSPSKKMLGFISLSMILFFASSAMEDYHEDKPLFN